MPEMRSAEADDALTALLSEYNLYRANLPARGELDAAVRFFEDRLADCDPWEKPGHARSLAYVKARRRAGGVGGEVKVCRTTRPIAAR